jgi:chemotaxis protein CheD
MSPSSVAVRIGELAASRSAGTVLSTIGLGSCIGLVLFDVGSGAVGLAHIMLPQSRGSAREPARYADVGVPALIAALAALGARSQRLEAVLVGGARLFAANQMEIGLRNSEAVAAALREAGIPVRARETGGAVGRSLWVSVDELSVTVRAANAAPTELYRARPASSPALIRPA